MHLVMGCSGLRGQWVGTDLALRREDDIIVGPHDGAAKLAEDDGLLRHGHVLFLAVVRVVHAHTHHLVWPCDWSQEGHFCPWQDWQLSSQGSAETRAGERGCWEWAALLQCWGGTVAPTSLAALKVSRSLNHQGRSQGPLSPSDVKCCLLPTQCG